ncbi:type i fatty acid, partial [Cystoisospora suis]
LICSLRHRVAPPNLHLRRFNPHIDIARGSDARPFLLPTKPLALDTILDDKKDEALIGAVSSFGFGGSNAHAIVEVPPVSRPSGPSENASITDADSTVSKAGNQPMVWLFTGQGSQYVDMARWLYESDPVFRQTIKECSDFLQSEKLLPESGPTRIEDVIYSGPNTDKERAESVLMQTDYSQVAILVVQLAITRMLNEKGLYPTAVLGHSLGEYAAAVAAGIFSWQDALSIVSHRARIMSGQPVRDGVMAACRVSAEQVQHALECDLQDLRLVALAADNGPQSVVISGTKSEVDRVLKHLGVSEKARFLRVSHAFHSPLMAGAVEPVRHLFDSVTFRAPKIPFASTVLGRLATDGEILVPEYWAEQ